MSGQRYIAPQTRLSPWNNPSANTEYLACKPQYSCSSSFETHKSRYDLTVPTLTKLPQFLREHNYINPEEDAKSPMQWTTGHSQFEWLAKNKHHQDLFNSYMSSRREEQLNWFNVYPLERLITGAKSHPDSVFLVDIGGNQGHDLSALRANCPKIPGRLILQDLPQIMANVDRREIEVMDHSFFGPPAYQK